MNAILTFTDDLKYKIVRVINVLAAKNTAEVRTLMKNHHLFDLRDTLLLELLNSEVQTTDSMQLLQQINLEALANCEKFRDKKTIESILSWILESKDPTLRKGFFGIFQKQICKSTENLKYLSKTLDDSGLVTTLSIKTLEDLDQYLGKAKGKGVEKVLKVANLKKAEKRTEQAKAANERSQKRSKTFTEIAKDKASIQELIVEYEKQETKYLATVGPHVVEKKLDELQGGCKKMVEEGKTL